MAEKQESEILREIAITLDVYDDIFSDFDPRPFAQRELSEDFLKEIGRRYMANKKGRFAVHFTIPSSERDLKEEALIKKRLRGHFAFMAKKEDDTINSIKKRGYLYIIIGMGVLLANTFMFFILNEESVAYQLLSIALVPAGWYGMFTGIGKVIDEPFDAVERKKLYEKFEHAAYSFMSEDRE